MRKGLDKYEPECSVDFGFGSEIYLIEYDVNGIKGKTTMCPNCQELFWVFLKRKHKLNKIKSFNYKILKEIGKSFYY